jgi:hypothetical protein
MTFVLPADTTAPTSTATPAPGPVPSGRPPITLTGTATFKTTPSIGVSSASWPSSNEPITRAAAGLESPAIEAARQAPHGELRTDPGVDHFDIYDGPEHEAVVADELAFLERHLLSVSPG